MKNFKYRVWQKSADKFLDMSSTFCIYQDGEYGSDPMNLFYKESSDDYVVQFYTGMKDKNGNEIYQGDIVLFVIDECPSASSSFTFQVIWCGFYGGWAFAGKDGMSLEHTGWKFYKCFNGVVVGNIFENFILLD